MLKLFSNDYFTLSNQSNVKHFLNYNKWMHLPADFHVIDTLMVKDLEVANIYVQGQKKPSENFPSLKQKTHI